MIKKNIKYHFSQKGMIALPVIAILSIIMLSIGLAMAFSAFTQNNITSNTNKADMAYYIAEAGIRDATMKITRNSNYNNSYSLSINNGSASISFDTSVPGQTKIISIGTFDNNSKKIETILGITTNGEVTLNSWIEN